MCNSNGYGVGLSGVGKWWTDTKEGFGFFSDWTYELAVQIVDICVSTREMNGGIIELSELLRLLRKLRGLPDPDPSLHVPYDDTFGAWTGKGKSNKGDGNGNGGISEGDVLRAIKTLEPLSSGYSIISLPNSGRKAVQSVRKEMDGDQHAIISLAASGSISPRPLSLSPESSSNSNSNPSAYTNPNPNGLEMGVVTKSTLVRAYGWTNMRTQTALDNAVRSGICWVDLQAKEKGMGMDMDIGGEVKYWVFAVLDL